VVEAVGVAPSPEFVVAAKAILTAKDSAQTSSMYRDLQRGVRIEADQIIGDLEERARARGIGTPLLSAIYTHLCVYQQRVTPQSFNDGSRAPLATAPSPVGGPTQKQRS